MSPLFLTPRESKIASLILFIIASCFSIQTGNAKEITLEELQIEPIKTQITVFSQKKFRNLEFHNLDQTLSEYSVEKIRDEGTPTKMRFFSSSRSQIYNYNGPRLIPVFENINGKKIHAANIYIAPKYTGRVLAFFYNNPAYSENPEKELKYKTLLINDDVDDFPAGQIKFVNMTTKNYRVFMGTDPIVVQPGISPAYGAGEQIKVNFLHPTNKKIIPIFTTTLRLEKDFRYALFLFPNENPDSIKLQPKLIKEVVSFVKYNGE